jgi:spoIIIJ-associated protein
MIKIEADSLEEAYKKASDTIGCSITELSIEIIQNPSQGVFGFFKKQAIIVATRSGILIDENRKRNPQRNRTKTRLSDLEERRESKVEKKATKKEQIDDTQSSAPQTLQERKKHYFNRVKEEARNKSKHKKHNEVNNTIIPTSFVNDQDDEEYEDLNSGVGFTADYDDEYDNNDSSSEISKIALEIQAEINSLFDLTCFSINEIGVSVYDENTILVEFKGDDAALLIGKEGYRYKALSYMLFNWINSKYNVQLRLEIAEFLKNQEESVDRYLSTIYQIVEKDGRAQTKILDGVLVQIALRKLREVYPDKYVVIRSTRDGLKYIIINDYHNN